MNTFAGLIGWLVIWTAAATVFAVALGKSLKFLGRAHPEPEDWDPAPRSLAAPHVPDQWHFDDEDLRDPTPLDPAP